MIATIELQKHAHTMRVGLCPTETPFGVLMCPVTEIDVGAETYQRIADDVFFCLQTGHIVRIAA